MISTRQLMEEQRGTKFSDVVRCPNCRDRGEKHKARFEWIVGQPDTER